MQKTFPLSKVRPNPFRDLNTYPIDEKKVDALIASFKKTGYWGNIVGRQNGVGVNIAYGHNRLEAMHRCMKKTDEVEIITKELSDADMIRIMADENMQEWGTSATIEQETIRAVVQAYANNKIELELPVALEETDEKKNQHGSTKGKKGGGGVRRAPHFQSCDLGVFRGPKNAKEMKALKPYNAYTVAEFLKWLKPGGQVSDRVRNALKALEAQEDDLIDPKDVKGLGSGQVRYIVEAARAIEKSYDRGIDSPQQKKVKKEGKQVAKKAAKAALQRLQTEVGKKNEPKNKNEIKAKDKNGAKGKRTAKPQKKKDKPKGIGIRDVVREMYTHRRPIPEDERLPDVCDFVTKLTRNLDKILSGADSRWEKLNEVVKFREDIDKSDKENLTGALNDLVNRCGRLIDAIEGKTTKRLLKGRKI